MRFPVEEPLATGGAGGELSPRQRRRKAPDLGLTAAAATVPALGNRAPR